MMIDTAMLFILFIVAVAGDVALFLAFASKCAELKRTSKAMSLVSPKAPLEDDSLDCDNKYFCPNCFSEIDYLKDAEIDYCIYCGQALEWEATNQ